MIEFIEHFFDMIKPIETFLSSYERIIAVLFGISGWVFHWWKSRRDVRLRIALVTENSNILLKNHGKEPIEVIRAWVSIRDPFTKPDLSQKHTIILSSSGSVSPTEVIELTPIEGVLLEHIIDICQPMMDRLRQFDIIEETISCQVFADFYITYSIVGDDITKVIKLERQIVGKPNLGWKIVYPPYYSYKNKPRWRKIIIQIQKLTYSIFTPVESWKRWTKYRQLGTYFEIRSILQAYFQKIISDEETETRLKKIATDMDMTVGGLFEWYISQDQ